MTFKITTLYAIRIMLYVGNALNGRRVGAKEISDHMQIPYKIFLKIVPSLKGAGLLAARRGQAGGYTLTSLPEKITLLQIVEAVEGTVDEHDASFEQEQIAEVSAQVDYDICCAMMGLQESWKNFLASITMKSLMKSNNSQIASKGIPALRAHYQPDERAVG